MQELNVTRHRRTISLMVRLLIPVNVISFFLLAAVFTLVVAKSQQGVDDATRSKVESISGVLQNLGRTYFSEHNLPALQELSQMPARDGDIAYLVFFDAAGRSLTDRSLMSDAPHLIRVNKQILSSDNKVLGHFAIGYETHRTTKAFNDAMSVGIVAWIATQLLLSLAIYLICRNSVSPLHGSLEVLSQVTRVLSRTSDEMASCSQSISTAVNQQAEVVHETSTAMSQMSSMLGQTSEYSKQSEQVMDSMTQKTNNGMTVMNEMVEAMTSIQRANEQLKQMVQIIHEISRKTVVINDIVFKTQLLSFNASIEAARAGQHGRGFAVVAEEVGNLAKMSGHAAQEIAALLQTSEGQVNEIVQDTRTRVSTGQMVTNQALKNFKDLARDISIITTHIANISAANREQELAVKQTSLAMNELNQTTELNNQVAHRASNSSRTLQREVQTLYSIAGAIRSSILGERRHRDRNPDLDKTAGESSESEKIVTIGRRRRDVRAASGEGSGDGQQRRRT